MILEIQGIFFSYRSIPVLKDITFSIKEGEMVGILGNNGAGKSTLIKCINRILSPQKGVIYLNKKDIRSIKRKEIAKLVGYVAQKYDYSNLTVFDVILLGRRPHIEWDATEKDLQIVEGIIRELKLEKIALRSVSEISGGELQKVIIGRALAQEPRVLLLDEPTNNLDLKNQIEVLQIIRDYVKNKNISALVVLHDINLALRFCDKFIFLKDNTIYAQGTMDVINENIIEEVYEVKVVINKINDIPIVVPLTVYS
ncbi:MAG: ABC transporter ATP-binding protein [Dictyoglomus thermophilum]|uniref:ABC transporter ATP-binding protein n=1 Tax=Dictyoglomus thermophilum TaxID=14 RepID=A0A7C3KTA9_DICTH|nr:ABC transporter ATP-binding protein [Dictyoglomus thermophilum]MCX7720830.1 ABC transporter ATP-binding protein [Dictyoglomus thermophilum]